MEELFNLLQEGQVEEAYQGFKKIYEEKNDLIALYYISMIDIEYHKDLALKDVLDNFNILVNCRNKKIRLGSYSPMLSICLEIEDYEKCYTIGKKALSEGVENFFVYMAYAKGLAYYKEVFTSEVEDNILKAINDQGINNELKKLGYMFLIEYYLKCKNFTKAREQINKLIFLFPQNDVLKYLELEFEVYKNSTSIKEEIISEALDSEYKVDSLVFLTDYFYENKQFTDCLKYLDLLKEFSSDPFQITKKEVLCLFNLNRFVDIIELLKKEDLNNNFLANYFIGEAYYSLGYKKDFKSAIPFYEKAYELSNDVDSLKSLCDCYYEIYDDKNLKKNIDILSSIDPKDRYLNVLKVKYYLLVNDFDRAEKEIDNAKYYGNTKEQLMTYLYQCAKKIKVTYPYYKQVIAHDNNTFYSLRAYYYGAYGIKINYQLVKKYLERALKEEGFNCLYSLIGTIIQDENPEKAMEFFSRGMERYQSGKDHCTCSIGCLCNAKLRGLGTNKNIQEAYDIAKKTIDECCYDVSENLGNVYAECSIELNKDLEDVYQFLIKSRERRHAISRLFMIIKVGKILKKDVANFEKEFKIALNNVTEKEREYYLSNPETFMMNNY